MTHTAAHLLIFFGYVAAMVMVPRTLAKLIPVHRLTTISGAGFFLFCGTTHVFLALDNSNISPVVTVTDHLQAAAILLFVFSLLRDLNRALAAAAATAAVVAEVRLRGDG